MSNVHTLKDINKRGHRLGSAYEQELEKKLRSVTEFNSEINDLSEKLVDKYNEREKEFQQTYADMENKASQLITSTTKVRSQLISERKSHLESQRELEAKYTAEIQSLKSEIKTLKRKATLSQKASSLDKNTILSLETKVHELEGKLDDLELDQVLHDSNVVGGLIDEPAQINSSDPKEIDSLRLELEQVRDDLSSKKYEIECMEKGIESSKNIYNQTIDSLFSARSNLIKANRSLREQLALKKNNEVDRPPPPINNLSQLGPEETLPNLDPTISVGGAEAVSLSQEMPLVPAVPAVESSLMPYAILALFLLIIIWIIGKKIWNSWSTNPREKNINKEQIPAEGTQGKGSHRPDIYYLKS